MLISDITIRIILNAPLIVFVLAIFIPAAIGKTIGFRKNYVQFLIWIFEYGKKRIARAEKKRLAAEEPCRNIDEHESSSEVSSTDEESFHKVKQDNSDIAVTQSDSVEVKSEQGAKRKRTYSMIKRNPSKLVIEAKRRMSSGDSSSVEQFLPPAGQWDFKEGIRSESISEDGEPIDDFLLSDIFEFVENGIEVIVNDQVTQRFVTEELRTWNLLTRTNRRYEFISFRLSFLYFFGCFARYWILLPIRLVIFVVSLLVFMILTAAIGLVPNSWKGKRHTYDMISRFCYRLFSRSFSMIATYHQKENKPSGGGICVANHTTVIDIVPLSCETSFALIGQQHGGFLGFLQWIIQRGTSHIFFERAEAKDRSAVTKRMKEHVENPNKLPILIFPEGTCINNSAVMQFKKGSFEVGGMVYPVAIKYDPRFGDAFWNSSEQSMGKYLLMMMTSWAIVCDIWYLPPMKRLDGESSIDFANRVKSAIARQGGLVDLDWDGQLKRNPAKREWKEKEQLKYSQKLAKALSPHSSEKKN